MFVPSTVEQRIISMCAREYIYMYICICICIYIYIYIYIYIHTHIYTYIHILLVYIGVCACMCLRLYIFSNVFKSATLFNIVLILFIYIPIHIFYIYLKTLILVLLYTYILVCLLNCNMLWSATNDYGCGAIPNKYIIIIIIYIYVRMFARIYVLTGVGGNSTTYVFLMHTNIIQIKIYTNSIIIFCFHFFNHIQLLRFLQWLLTKIQKTSGIVGELGNTPLGNLFCLTVNWKLSYMICLQRIPFDH